jgi:hypothetical protein
MRKKGVNLMAASMKQVKATCGQENKIGMFGTIESEKYSIL